MNQKPAIPPGTHVRFDDGYQEWQLVSDETHEVLLADENQDKLYEKIRHEL